MKAFTREPIEIIPEWLAATRDVDIPVGLSCEEGLLRAGKLRQLIREGEASPKNVELDEEGKDVLYALVRLLAEAGREPSIVLAKEANAIYLFIRSVEWPSSEFDEKAELLRWCVEVGWKVAGYRLQDIREARSTSEADSMITVRLLGGGADHSCLRVDTDELVSRYLEASTQTRDFIRDEICPHVFAALSNALSRRGIREPKAGAAVAQKLYWQLESMTQPVWLFDEKDYVLGALALIAGGAYRQLGAREATEEWLARAEERFNLTITSGLLDLHIACERLAMGYERRLYDSVLVSARQLKRLTEAGASERIGYKCRLIEALALKELNRVAEADQAFGRLAREFAAANELGLLGQCFVNWGNLLSMNGRYEEALDLYEKAETIAKSGISPAISAHLYSAIGECLRDQGILDRAIEYYRASFAEYSACGMTNWAAYTQVLLAETLIAAGRSREAEKEIVAALPIIEERKLVHEGLAATVLLKESIRRRKMDPNALRELRGRLQSKRWE